MKYCINLLLLFITCLSLNAQTNWLMKAGSGGNDEALAIATNSQGDIFTTGYFIQPALFGTTTLIPSGSGDVFIAKQNSAGIYQWAVKAGGTGSDRGLGICTDADGNIYITGFYSGTAQFGSFTLNSNAASQDVYVAKLNPTGVFEWAVSYGGNDIDLPSGIAIDAQANLIVTGQFKGAGVFGNNQFNSVINPLTNEASYDIFILKINSTGNLQWAKHGQAKNDDRGLQAATDAAGNIYLTGQYSDTLKLTNIYPNVAYNVCYLMKLSPAGQEVWFKRLQASLTAVTGLVCKNDNLYLTGDFLGQLVLTGPPAINLSSTFARKIFIAKYTTAGAPVWAQADGSANPLAARAIAVDDNGNAYVTGNFKCAMTEYSDLYGVGVFNSVGFRDIFVVKYDGTGQRLWERQLGGTGDDFAAAMVINTEDKPIICGSFEKNFNAPSAQSFIDYPLQNVSLSGTGPNNGLTICGDGNYGNFVSLSSTGNKDILSMMAVDLQRQPYDYYSRWGLGCARDTLMPYLNQGQDTVKACGRIELYPTLKTGLDGTIGPEYEYLWSTGSTNDTIEVTTSGQYILNYKFIDDCRVYSDTIYAVVHPNPPSFDITSPYGPIINATPVFDCINKLLVAEGDTAKLVGPPPPPGFISYWTLPNGQTVNNQNEILTSLAGNYTYTIATADGYCFTTSCVQIFLYGSSPGNCLPGNFNPYIFFPGYMGTDTLRMCPRDTFTAIFADSSLYMQGIPHVIPLFGRWNNTPQIAPANPYSTYTILYHSNTYSAQETGPASITVQLIPPPGNGAPLLSYTRHFYLEVYPEPVNNTVLNGQVDNGCPGDTTQIFVSGGDNYIFTGGTINAIAQDSSWFKVTQPGTYYVYSTVFDPVNGCINRDTANITVSYKTAPLVAMNPASGLICPNDSVLLSAQPGADYYWVGPLGDTISVASTAYATSAGNYFYIMTDGDNCTQVSEFVEVREYSTPFLGADPGNVLCPGGTVTLTIDTDPGVQIVWGPPLSGSGNQQVVGDTGTYTVSVSFCDITTTLSIHITSPTVEAEISIVGDSVLCAAQPVTLLANPGNYEYEWLPVGEFSPQLLVEEEGTYTLVVTDENGCTARDSISFIMLPSPLPPTTVSGDTVCLGDSANVFAAGQGIVAWYLSNNTPYIALGEDYTTPPITGQEILYAGIVDTLTGCRSLLLPIDLFVKPQAEVPVITIDTTVCLGATFSVLVDSVMGNIALTWQGPGINPTNANPFEVPNFSADNEGAYYLIAVATDSTICGSDTATFNLAAVTLPQIALPGDTLTVCIGSDIIIAADTAQGVTYNWVWPGGSGMGATVEIINFQQGDEGFYSVTALNAAEGCVATDSVFADAVPLPVVVLSTAPLICQGDSLAILATATGLPAGAEYAWTGPTNFEQADSSIFILDVTPAASGEYTLQITTPGCSPLPQSISVVVNTIDTLSLVADTVFCNNGALQLAVPANYAMYSWNTGATTPQMVTDSAGLYIITVKADNGCTDADSITVEEVECSFGDLPNVFTPNGDGINDDYIFDVPGAQNITIEIYNRWGNLVRKLSGNSNLTWDATNNSGTNVSDGVYYYLGFAKLIDGKDINVSGYIQVLK